MRKSFARIVPMIALSVVAAACTDQITQPVETSRMAPIDTFASARASIDTFYLGQRAPSDTFYVAAQRAHSDTFYVAAQRAHSDTFYVAAQRAPIDTFYVASVPIDTIY